jgi:glycosyltransferase involved in cell wall biosynthesis
MGQLLPETLYPIVQKARFIVVPSVCYENNPLSAIEALCMGTPVLGARIGGIPELIEEGQNGELFTPGDRTELKHKIDAWYSNATAFDSEKIAFAAYNKYSPESFYNKLMKIYNHSQTSSC